MNFAKGSKNDKEFRGEKKLKNLRQFREIFLKCSRNFAVFFSRKRLFSKHIQDRKWMSAGLHNKFLNGR